MISRSLLFFLLIVSLTTSLTAQQVTTERLLHPEKEPQNWLTYSGSYASQRYSTLDQITAANAKNLELKWVFQVDNHTGGLEKFETTPLVIDGIMYITEPPNVVAALDAKTGRAFWTYTYTSQNVHVCCGQVNRGLAILGDTLFLGTLDAHVVALDAKNGSVLWNVPIADAAAGYAITHAPLVVKDKVIVGVAGGEYGIRGFIAAYSVSTGKEMWRFNTIPAPGEPGHETWPAGDSWQHGGGPAWLTGSYDPDLNLLYWGTGNPGPDWNGDARAGDNLYTDCVLALDPDTGKLKWHFQFTPHDLYDYDAIQIPVLVDANWQGTPRKLMMWANRNGFFYVLDRTNGQFLLGSPFVKTTWATTLDKNGRPIPVPGQEPTTAGVKVYPGNQGATNWFSPSYSPHTRLFYVSTWSDFFAVFSKNDTPFREGALFFGGNPATAVPYLVQGPIKAGTVDDGYGTFAAIDPFTGQKKWEFKMTDVTDSGLLSTVTDVLFGGGREGHFYALDARNGTVLWKQNLGGMVDAVPMTYMVDGKQYITIAAGHGLFTFALRD